MTSFFISVHGEKELQQFPEELNKTHPNLKFTHESSKEKILSLDLFVSLFYGKLHTNLHIKTTDRHQYLKYTSSHPDNAKKSTVYSQALRLSRLCSFEEDFEPHKSSMKSKDKK